MTFKELFESACKIDPSDSIAIKFEAWRYNYPSTSTIKGTWTIWSANLSKHFNGQTAKAALVAYKDASNEISTKYLNNMMENISDNQE